MESSGDFNSSPELDYERFIDVVRSLCGRYTPGGIGPETFGGTARAGSICGFVTVSLSCNAPRVERTHRDFRSDGMEHYYAIFQMAGQSTVVQNDHTVELTVGDVALVDAARPVTYVSEKRNGHWLSLQGLLVGSAIVAASSLYILWRETVRRRRPAVPALQRG